MLEIAKNQKKSLSSSIVNDFCHFSLVRQRQIAHLNDFDAFLWDLQRHFERFLQSWSVDDVGECRKEDSFTSEFSSFLRAEKENVIRSLLYVFLQRESHDYWVAFASNLESLRALTMMTMLMCWNYMIWKLQKKEREWEVWLMRFFFFASSRHVSATPNVLGVVQHLSKQHKKKQSLSKTSCMDDIICNSISITNERARNRDLLGRKSHVRNLIELWDVIILKPIKMMAMMTLAYVKKHSRSTLNVITTFRCWISLRRIREKKSSK